MSLDDIVWRPDPATSPRARASPASWRAHGIASLAELQRRSVDDPEWYWDAVVARPRLPLDHALHAGARRLARRAWPRWFAGGPTEPRPTTAWTGTSTAGRGEQARGHLGGAKTGRSRTLTYAELAREVNRLANALRRSGSARATRVGIFLPMSPEAVIATLAVGRIGAIYTPCFSGYGAQAVASRLQDCDAKVLITADGFYRRGQVVPMKRDRRRGGGAVPTVEHVLVLPAHSARDDPVDGRARSLVARGRSATESTDVPGAAGRGRSPVPHHLHVGDHRAAQGHRAHPRRLLDQDRARLRLSLRRRRERPAVLGHRPRLAHGADAHHRRAAATAAPRCSSRARRTIRSPIACGRSCERHRITHLGISPTAVRALMPHGAEWVTRTISRRCASSAPPASRGIPSPIAGSSSTSGKAPRADHQLHRRHRDLRRHPRLLPDRADQALLVHGPDSRHGRRRASARTASRCAGRWASWWSRSPWPGHDGGLLAGPRALRGDLLVALAGRLGARRLGVRGRRRLLVHPGPLGRHAQDRRQAAWGRPRSSRCWSAIRPSPRRRAIGVPHEIKGEAVVCFAVLRPGLRRRRSRSAPSSSTASRRPWARPSARAGALRARAAQDPQRQDHAPGDPRDLSGQGPGRSLVAGEPWRREGDRRGGLAEDLLHRVHAFVHGLADLLGGRGAAAGSARGRAGGGGGPRPPRSKGAGSAARGCPRYFPRSRKWCAPRC